MFTYMVLDISSNCFPHSTVASQAEFNEVSARICGIGKHLKSGQCKSELSRPNRDKQQVTETPLLVCTTRTVIILRGQLSCPAGAQFAAQSSMKFRPEYVESGHIINRTVSQFGTRDNRQKSGLS